ncbi:YegP family protein [Gordonia sp. DT218]|uniref:YegP family protein n=1 Tax=Gordonia sp. DT218 TaxID=3416659 RepID=UPI003CF320A6
MIDFENPPTMAADCRGTIEVYPAGLDWRWRCKSKNGQILGSGEGYSRKAGALNAIEAQYELRLATTDGLTDALLDSSGDIAAYLVVPWRIVVRDRAGQVAKIGALY